MALTFTVPSTAGPVGPGYQVVVTRSAGPNPLDDYVEVSLSSAGPFFGSFCFGRHMCVDGSLTQSIILGVVEFVPPQFTTGEIRGLFQPIAAGGTCALTAVWRHANGTSVENGNIAACTWDPVGGLGEVLSDYWRLNAWSGGLSTAILAAVTHEFPTTS